MSSAPDGNGRTGPLPAQPLPTAEEVTGILRGVIDPELGSDIVELGMARGVRIDPDGTVHVTPATALPLLIDETSG